AGAGVARELALRGVSVALVEKGDFASATTSQSSKLVHGGLRYLELFDFGLVRESLHERETLRRLAPHLVRPLPFLVPIYRDSSRSLIKVRIGLKLYDWLTPGRRRERYRVLPAVDALSLEPMLRAGDLRGAGYYFDDLLLFPERLCLENILSACRLGARAFNYTQVAEIARDQRGVITSVRARDLLTGKVATLGARIVVNATGPWVDELRAAAGVSDRGPQILRRTKGIHCLVPRLTDRAIYHSTRDDRMIFVIPWREFSLIGATATDFNADLERLHRRPVAPARDKGRGRLPPGGGAQGAARPAGGDRSRGLHVRRRAAAVVREGQARVRRLARPQGGRRGARAVPVDHRDQAHVLPESGGDARRSGHAKPRAPRREPQRAHRPRRHRRRGVVAGRGARLARRLGRGGGHGALAGPARAARVGVGPRRGARAGARRQGGGRDRAAVPLEPRYRRPVAPRGAGRAGRLAAGRAAAPHRNRHQPMSGTGLRGGDRAAHGAALRLVARSARRRARGLSRLRRSLAQVPRVARRNSRGRRRSVAFRVL